MVILLLFLVIGSNSKLFCHIFTSKMYFYNILYNITIDIDILRIYNINT